MCVFVKSIYDLLCLLLFSYGDLVTGKTVAENAKLFPALADGQV